MLLFLRHRDAVGAIVMAVVVANLNAFDAAAAQTLVPRATGGFAVADVAGRKCTCNKDYRPVCARLPNGARRTFSNACTADCSDATVIRRGKC